jgi:biopolymer transport protein ExbD
MAGATHTSGPIHGINITPLVDIFLVLLILVMISSTLVRPSAIEVDLPRSKAPGQSVPEASSIVLDAQGAILLDGMAVDAQLALARLSAKSQSDSGHQVLVSASGHLPYQKVVEVLDLVKASGARKYALQVQPEATP